ncbi:helix-turn-helix transcriptional regulator [Phenylobacterium sp.]|jgi:transcriptional regulator with XRE-family HTH domain|uniref:helix-turn-helix domain-containing protein n=1 Tax=Phenylobacterium sp. TaxID=1871053 RepID=UPI002E3014E1|nr:helix-turn-helix transcriptional regulator [Phenylobacterium sp.]HEX3365657.1 helix-turn-helix transcriptional regulator [Phenylobacterium sp.]
MTEIVDVHLGRRLRQRRRLLHLTQSDLAATCGVGFQQIQKYECATHRISAAMLWRLAGALGVGTQYFYEGLDSEASAEQRVA